VRRQANGLTTALLLGALGGLIVLVGSFSTPWSCRPTTTAVASTSRATRTMVSLAVSSSATARASAGIPREEAIAAPCRASRSASA
jgi:hypothetical protein